MQIMRRPRGTGGKREYAGKGPRHLFRIRHDRRPDKLNRHTLGITLGTDWNKSLYSLAGSSFTTLQGEFGNATNQAVFMRVGIRFR